MSLISLMSIYTTDQLEPAPWWHAYVIGWDYCSFLHFINFVHFFRSLQVNFRFISIQGFWLILTLWLPFNMVYTSNTMIVYCHLSCWVHGGRYTLKSVTGREFPLTNNEDLLSTEYGNGKLFAESLSKQLLDCHQICCHRAAVRWLLSEWL